VIRILAAALVAACLGATAAGLERPAWMGPVRTGTILAGEQRLFSYELRQTDGRVLPVITELLVCRARGELFRLVVTKRKADFSLELGYHSRAKRIEPVVFLDSVPTRDAEVPRDPTDPSRFLVPMSKLKAGSEELEFAVPDLFLPTVQRWLDEAWKGTTPDVRQAMSDVIVASRLAPFGMGEDVAMLVGLVPGVELKAAAQEARLRRVDRGADLCAQP
jgi:hypothetical protein